jgi:transposase-like protein
MGVEKVPHVDARNEEADPPGAFGGVQGRGREAGEGGKAQDGRALAGFGLADSLVRSWVRQADVDAGKGPVRALTTAEKEELSHLRREVKVVRMEREILKKGGHFLRQGERVKFAFISEEKVAFPVSVLCRLLAVSPSGYYINQGRPVSPHRRRDKDLSARVTASHLASKRRYGSPRVHADLKAAGQCVDGSAWPG